MAHVLVVAADSGVSDPIADELERNGEVVSCCPGPQAPEYVCQGGREGRCPLVRDADVVILDGWLESDAKRSGVPSWHLLRFYRSQNVPVVALVGPDGLPGPVHDNGVKTMSRDATPRDIEWAVRSLMDETEEARAI